MPTSFAHRSILPIQEEEDIQISAKCAAVLVVAGTGLGAGVAYTLTPAAICAAGFCPAGVAGGSFAAWWQSSIPLVAKGSLFAQLQALASAGVGTKAVTVAGGLLGGTMGVNLLRDICSFVDSTDPASPLGKALGTCVAVVSTAVETHQSLEAYCASSETCVTVAGVISDARAVATKTVSSLWDSVTTSMSDAAARVRLYYDIVQLDNKKSVRLLHAAARVRLYHDIVQLDKKSVRLLQNLVHSSMSDESLEVLNSITTKLEETKAEL